MRLFLIFSTVVALTSCQSRWPVNDVNLNSFKIEKIVTDDGGIFINTTVESKSINSCKYPVARIVSDSNNALVFRFDVAYVGDKPFISLLDYKNITELHLLYVDENDRVIYIRRELLSDIPVMKMPRDRK